jgi:membrane-associated phospholipid phosphatase
MGNSVRRFPETPLWLSPLRLTLLVGLAALPGLILADRSLMMAAQAWYWPPLVEAMQIFTWLGYGAVDIGVPIVVGLIGWWRDTPGDLARGAWGAGSVALAGILDQVVKNISCRARPNALGAGTFFATFPCFPAPYALASFPSGHATTAFATAVLLTLWYPRSAGLCIPLAVLVGLSRIMLLSHFPSDVLAGALLGTAVALAVHAHVPAARRPRATRATAPAGKAGA